MCLVVFANDVFADFPFVLAANRDEYFARPSASAAWWMHEGVEIFGGRDLEKNGTWLGLTRAGRIAVVTNVRDLAKPIAGTASRGWLTRDALTRKRTATLENFPSYNVIVASRDGVWYTRDDIDTVSIARGIHGLSNHRLDTPWPKVERAKSVLAAQATPEVDALFAMLADRTAARDEELPKTGVPLEVERALSSPFVSMPEVGYGTRCSTVILRARDVMHFEERTFDERGAVVRIARDSITIAA